MKSSNNFIEAIYQKLGGDDGPYRGVTYNKTNCDTIEYLQTPRLWGHAPTDNQYWVQDCEHCRKDPDFNLPYCSNGNCGDHGGYCRELQAMTSNPADPQKGPVCQASGDYVHDKIYQTIIKAQYVVDISTLAPFPTGRFLASIHNALRYLAHTGRRIVVRVLGGAVMSSGSEEGIKKFISAITKGLNLEKSQLKIFVAMATTYLGLSSTRFSPSWNHSKIIAIDGNEAIIGGQNWWQKDYLEFAPIHDISMLVTGDAALEAHNFLNRYWHYISSTHRHFSVVYRVFSRSWVPPQSSKQDSFPRIIIGRKSRAGNTLSLGKLAHGIVNHNPSSNASRTARNFIIHKAQKSVKLLQQDILFKKIGITYEDKDLMDALGQLLSAPDKKVTIEIILSHHKGKSGRGIDYAWGFTAAFIHEKIIKHTVDNFGAVTGKLKVAALRFADSQGNQDFEWTHGHNKYHIGNHAKVYIIDDRAFCIGSDNAYPCNLQEFALFVEDEQATTRLLEDYWNKAWQYSKVGAIKN